MRRHVELDVCGRKRRTTSRLKGENLGNDMGVKDISEKQDEDDVPEALEKPEDETPDTHKAQKFESEEQINHISEIKEQMCLNPDRRVLQPTKKNMVKKDGKFYCVLCDYVAGRGQSGSMMEHIRFKHEGIGFPCNQCPYKASRKVQIFFIIFLPFNGKL